VGDNPVVAVAVVGYGRWGRRLVDIAQRTDAFDVVLAADERFGSGLTPPDSVPVVQSLGAVLADSRVDAVLLAVPASVHQSIAEQCLELGTHVFVEKPLATDSVGAMALVETARRTGRVLAVDHHYRFNPAVEVLRASVADGRIGKVASFFAERRGRGPRREDVNALWDLAVHDLTIASRVGAITAQEWAAIVPESRVIVLDGLVAGCVTVTGASDRGVSFELHSCWMSRLRSRRVAVSGSAGVLELVENGDVTKVVLSTLRQTRTLYDSRNVTGLTPVEHALEDFARRVRGDHSNDDDLYEAVAFIKALERMSAATSLRHIDAMECWR
jgi:predicted dehydrogenase